MPIYRDDATPWYSRLIGPGVFVSMLGLGLTIAAKMRQDGESAASAVIWGAVFSVTTVATAGTAVGWILRWRWRRTRGYPYARGQHIQVTGGPMRGRTGVVTFSDQGEMAYYIVLPDEEAEVRISAGRLRAIAPTPAAIDTPPQIPSAGKTPGVSSSSDLSVPMLPVIMIGCFVIPAFLTLMQTAPGSRHRIVSFREWVLWTAGISLVAVVGAIVLLLRDLAPADSRTRSPTATRPGRWLLALLGIAGVLAVVLFILL